MNDLEKQLSSWKPRPASDKIERRLFPNGAGAGRPSRALLSWNWLGPVAACFVTLLAVSRELQPRPGAWGSPGADRVFATVSLSSMAASNVESHLGENQLSLTKLDLNLEWNVWSRATFESTNQARSSSSMDSLTVARTNNSRL